MNKTQRLILIGALVAIVVTLLFPPFQVHYAQGRIAGAGYGFIFFAREYNGVSGTVDVALLLAEWFAIGIVCALLWVLNRPPGETSFLARLIATINHNTDVRAEVARIDAASRERLAEIQTPRPAQMDLLDRHR